MQTPVSGLYFVFEILCLVWSCAEWIDVEAVRNDREGNQN